jgi:hypothetical protein
VVFEDIHAIFVFWGVVFEDYPRQFRLLGVEFNHK